LHHSPTGAIWIGEGDAEHLLQYVRELIDLLDSVLGKPNQYSRQISAYYGNGLQNMYGSPSPQSVRDITSIMKAVQTHVARPTTVVSQNESEEVREMKCDVMDVCLNGHKITGCVPNPSLPSLTPVLTLSGRAGFQLLKERVLPWETLTDP
jgi:hypothetical protein